MNSTILSGVPILALEILSPSDQIGEIDRKIDLYLEVHVPQVWIVHPYRRTVTIYRPNLAPQAILADQELSGDPDLPGFRVRVQQLFE